MSDALETIGGLFICPIGFAAFCAVIIWGTNVVGKVLNEHREYTRISSEITVLESKIIIPEPLDMFFKDTYYTGTLKDDKGNMYKADDYRVTVTSPDGNVLHSYDKIYIKIFQKILKKHLEACIKMYDEVGQKKKDSENKKFEEYIKGTK